VKSAASLSEMLRRLWSKLAERRRRQFMMLLGLMVVSTIAEVVSLGAILPFIGVLAAPDVVFESSFVADIARSWGIRSGRELVLPLTVAFAVIAMVTGAIRILLVWASTRFTFATGAELSMELYSRTLYQPYRVHVSRSSSEVISGITAKVGGTVLGIMLPFMTLLSSAMLLVAILLTLIAIEPVVALIATFGFGGCYAVITWVTRRRLRRNSQRISEEQTQVIKALQEGLGGIRDVLLDGTQPVFCAVYRRADQRLRRAQGENVFIAQAPRYAIEAAGMVMIAALAYGLSSREGGVATALPVLGALALGAQRLLPALQQAYAAWATILGNGAALSDTLELLDQPIAPELSEPAPPALSFQQHIRFAGVRFRYGEEGPWVLDGIDLTIPKGACIGFVGGTGSGKSTTMDLLMALLMPTEGEVLTDGEPVSGRRIRAWQRTIAHVPQSIYLADSSVAENIAFGVPPQSIDRERVREAARQAQIAEFIESRPEGYDAFVGERGIRLSGGQRQRIGIARALYKRASVLVLDEATSALDNVTEQSVMDAVGGLERGLTILLIAHRLSTVRRCDTIVELEQGRVVAHGTYEELLERSASFRRMVHAAD
jgi:ATP-binding cassette, subfamily B, bacterial PglK